MSRERERVESKLIELKNVRVQEMFEVKNKRVERERMIGKRATRMREGKRCRSMEGGREENWNNRHKVNRKTETTGAR